MSGKAPRVSGETLTGTTVTPSAQAGKVVIVNFWNPYCAPCRREQPVLQRSWRALRARGVYFVGLMFVGGNPRWPNDPEAARSWIRRFGVTYPELVDEKSRFAKAFGIEGIPSTIVVDRSGRMRLAVLGEVRPGELEFLVDEVE